MMIDLHTHSLFSDGELLPSELIRRAVVCGYQAIAVTDHADFSNYDFIIPRIIKICSKINMAGTITAIAGIELTHVFPDDIAMLAADARSMGAGIVVVHGETIVEPVAPGTNSKAIDAGIDILAHPGLITVEEVQRAASKGVFLEISSRGGHSLCNGHVAHLAKKYNARLVLNSDAHAPYDLLTREHAEKVAIGSGLDKKDFVEMLHNSKEIVAKTLKK